MNEAKEEARPTLDQRRANHGWLAIEKVLQLYPGKTITENGKAKSIPNERAKKYGGQAKKLPTRIMAAGLGQALAFLYAKEYAPDLLVALSDWVLEKRGKASDASGPLSAEERPALKDALLQRIVKGNADDLRRWTDESLAYLVWLNRFAEARGLTEGEQEYGA